MTRINCLDHGCKHNCTDCCTKEEIKVSTGAFCHSYEFDPKENREEYLEKMDQEYAQDFLMEHTKGQCIECNSETCQHNSDGRCDKTEICVAHKDFGAKCLDYIHRQ